MISKTAQIIAITILFSSYFLTGLYGFCAMGGFILGEFLVNCFSNK